MKFLVLSDLHMKSTAVGDIKNNSRAVGAYYVTQEARKLGIDAINIDYFLSWPKELLLKSMLTWFGDEKECVIGYSGSIDASGRDYYKSLVQELQKDIPQLKVMLGGFREPQGDSSWIDLMLIGRCTNILLDYLKGEDISQFQVHNDPPCYKNPTGVIMEPPVYNIVREEDYWQPQELMTIETALGCKFNCSFCGYDYRNNKKPQLNTVDRIVESMQSAYDLGGITNFFLADDTINEVDSKLELLGEVKRQLTFEPWLMSFARMDIIGAKPHQVDLFNECNLNGLYFGIESMNPAVTKHIRKGGKPEKNYETMRLIKQNMPKAFTYGNFIMGLTGDSEKSIWEHAENIVNEQLLTSAGTFTLRIYSNLLNDEIKSEFDKDPAKYGYKIIDPKYYVDPKLGYNSDYWENDWTNREEAHQLNIKINAYFSKYLESVFSAHEISSMKALLPNMRWGEYNNQIVFAQGVQDNMMQKYIKDKSNWLLT